VITAPAFSNGLPYSPRVEAQLMPGGSDNIASWGWDANITVDVAVNGSAVASDLVPNNGSFWVNTSLSAGDTVVLTASDGVEKSLVVADHQLITADLPGDVATGTATPDPEGIFYVWATEPASPTLAPSVDPVTHEWIADFAGAGYDLAGGVGLQVRQDDADGDGTLTFLPIANPLVEIWDTHGVALSGWTPYSPVTITLDNPTDGQGPLVLEVTTDAQGSYWDASPEGWSPLEPGWIATATGSVPQRETPQITKTLVVPDPIPVPEIDDVVVSDTVTTLLTDQSVGAGSRATLVAYCAGSGGQGTSRDLTTDPVTGYFSVDMSVDPVPPVQGFGEACLGYVHVVLYRLFDTDGDMFQAWWLQDPTPSLTLFPEIFFPGDYAFVNGFDWDLGTVSLVQCRLDGDQPDFPDGCDWSTRVDTTSAPSEGWPLARADFGVEFLPVTELSTVGGPVDCSASGSCGVVGFEPWRPGAPMAVAPLTFAATLDVEGLAKGTVSTVTGNATVNGTVTASTPVWVHLSGELRQRLGRTRVVVGWFDTWVYVDQADTLTSWSAVVQPQTGQAFGSGKAEMTVWVDQGDGYQMDQDIVTVSLTSSKKK
jgi:hypothetical protein